MWQHPIRRFHEQVSAGPVGRGDRQGERAIPDASFRGEERHKVDAKGRVSIPADFRRALQAGDPQCSGDQNPEMILVYGPHLKGYLECYTVEAAAKVDAQIQSMKRGSPERNLLQVCFNGHSKRYVIDDTGRIVLTQKFKEKIGLKDTAYFIATGDTFQIWDAETYESTRAAAIEAQLAALPEGFDLMAMLPDDALGGAAGAAP